VKNLGIGVVVAGLLLFLSGLLDFPEYAHLQQQYIVTVGGIALGIVGILILAFGLHTEGK
jgi:hypothetical protein